MSRNSHKLLFSFFNGNSEIVAIVHIAFIDRKVGLQSIHLASVLTQVFSMLGIFIIFFYAALYTSTCFKLIVSLR